MKYIWFDALFHPLSIFIMQFNIFQEHFYIKILKLSFSLINVIIKYKIAF